MIINFLKNNSILEAFGAVKKKKQPSDQTPTDTTDTTVTQTDTDVDNTDPGTNSDDSLNTTSATTNVDIVDTVDTSTSTDAKEDPDDTFDSDILDIMNTTYKMGNITSEKIFIVFNNFILRLKNEHDINIFDIMFHIQGDIDYIVHNFKSYDTEKFYYDFQGPIDSKKYTEIYIPNSGAAFNALDSVISLLSDYIVSGDYIIPISTKWFLEDVVYNNLDIKTILKNVYNAIKKILSEELRNVGMQFNSLMFNIVPFVYNVTSETGSFSPNVNELAEMGVFPFTEIHSINYYRSGKMTRKLYKYNDVDNNIEDLLHVFEVHKEGLVNKITTDFKGIFTETSLNVPYNAAKNMFMSIPICANIDPNAVFPRKKYLDNTNGENNIYVPLPVDRIKSLIDAKNSLSNIIVNANKDLYCIISLGNTLKDIMDGNCDINNVDKYADNICKDIIDFNKKGLVIYNPFNTTGNYRNSSDNIILPLNTLGYDTYVGGFNRTTFDTLYEKYKSGNHVSFFNDIFLGYALLQKIYNKLNDSGVSCQFSPIEKHLDVPNSHDNIKAYYYRGTAFTFNPNNIYDKDLSSGHFSQTGTAYDNANDGISLEMILEEVNTYNVPNNYNKRTLDDSTAKIVKLPRDSELNKRVPEYILNYLEQHLQNLVNPVGRGRHYNNRTVYSSLTPGLYVIKIYNSYVHISTDGKTLLNDIMVEIYKNKFKLYLDSKVDSYIAREREKDPKASEEELRKFAEKRLADYTNRELYDAFRYFYSGKTPADKSESKRLDNIIKGKESHVKCTLIMNYDDILKNLETN